MQRIDVAGDTNARRLRLMHLQRLSDPLQRVPRGDLRLAASIDIAAGAGVRDRARRGPLAAQAFEPRAVHRLDGSVHWKRASLAVLICPAAWSARSRARSAR